ncbi:hypothetical protein WJX73_009076 [Symbiochloris irregularis]|uniref:Uncharacterized protein n=1 Tax=Symbiochloris irregularis TaxID=706552 RepID=A0AAW1P7J2_9CHLO
MEQHSELASLLTQKERELAALRARSIDELQEQVTKQQQQLTALQGNFDYNLRLLDARDAELSAVEAKLAGQEEQTTTLQRTVTGLQSTLSQTEAEFEKQQLDSRSLTESWEQERQQLTSAVAYAEQRCNDLRQDIQECRSTSAATQQLARESGDSAMREMHKACSQHLAAQEQHTSLVARLQTQLTAATEAQEAAKADAQATKAAMQSSRDKMRDWVARWEKDWTARLDAWQMQHRTAMRKGAAELAVTQAEMASMRQDLDRAQTALAACRDEASALKEEAGDRLRCAEGGRGTVLCAAGRN